MTWNFGDLTDQWCVFNYAPLGSSVREPTFVCAAKRLTHLRRAANVENMAKYMNRLRLFIESDHWHVCCTLRAVSFEGPEVLKP